MFTVRLSDPKCKFSASHFLYNHEKCSRLHGHNYLVDVEVTGPLNDQYLVVDFFELKTSVMQIVDFLDHAVLLPENSPEMQIVKEDGQIKVDFNNKHYEFPEMDVRLLPIEASTAELLAKYIYDQLKVNFQAYQLRVEVGESEGSVAIYTE